MANPTRKSIRWGKPPISDKLERRERRFSILSNLGTLLLTAIIISGGFMIPTLLYPYLNIYHDNLVQLPDPSEYVVEEYVFENPPMLYPWILYEEDQTRSLNTSERSYLESKGIPQFVLATMYDHGLEPTKGISEYYSQILNSFRYLELRDNTDDNTESGCYFLVDFDIDGDNTPDLSCAVDLEGTILSVLFLSDTWDTVTITAPIGMSTPPFVGESSIGSTATSTDTGTATSQNEGMTTQGAGQTGTTGASPTQEQNTGTGSPDPGQTGTEAIDEDEIEQNPADENPPSDNHKNIWSFAYAISREAQLIDQQSLFLAFRQIEYYYEVEYGYPYTMLLPTQSTEDEVLPEIEYVQLIPQVLPSNQYILHIYTLPTGKQLILYLEPSSFKCMGFNLLS